jgi:hypothetical protein
VAVVSISSVTPLDAGTQEIVRLTAQVPDTAPYRASHVLDLAAVSVNGGAIAAFADDAVHLAVYAGDTTGNGSYSSLDAQRILRVSAGLDGGFATYLRIDPVLIADITGNGALSSLDATRILQESVGLDRPEIPPLPGIPVPPPVPSGETAPVAAFAAVDDETHLLGAIAGIVFEDLNTNGMRESGEAGLSGWTIYLDSNGNRLKDSGELSTVTAPDGTYRFLNLPAGSYELAQVMREEWRLTNLPQESGVAASIQALSTTGSEFALTLPGEFLDAASIAGSTGLNNLAEDLIDLTAFRADSRFANTAGEGMTVVVIDTGADLNHGAFGPDSNGDGIADRIVYQYDFADDDNDASDRTGHGSVVSSIIGSGDPVSRGVAPLTRLIVLKVFSDSGSGTFGYLEQALQWSIANAELYNVAVVNLSLGDGGNWSVASSRYGIGDELAMLAAMDVLVVAAAGNNFFQSEGALGVAYPGADPAVLAVGAVWSGSFGGPWRFSSGATDHSTTADQIAAFSQRHAVLTDVFAPGARLSGANANGGSLTLQGTSQAAAYLSGNGGPCAAGRSPRTGTAADADRVRHTAAAIQRSRGGRRRRERQRCQHRSGVSSR